MKVFLVFIVTFLAMAEVLANGSSFNISYLNQPVRGLKAIKVSKNFKNRIIGARVGDVRYAQVIEGLDSLHEDMTTNPRYYFNGAEAVLNVFFNKMPAQRGSEYFLNMTAFVKQLNGSFEFIKLQAIYTPATKAIALKTMGTVPLRRTRFEGKVGLIQRKLVLTDTQNDIEFVFPLGVGSFDEAVMNKDYSLLTPRYKKAFLTKNEVIFARKKPRYFKKKPFIRVMNDGGSSPNYDGIGFHAQPNLDTFIRAFDSHGCMRMQLDDLYALYYLVANNPLTRIPLTISYEIENKMDSPFPRKNRRYRSIKNYGSTGMPLYSIDRDYLVDAQLKKGKAPVSQLKDHPNDHYHNLFNYTSMACRAKSFDRPKRGIELLEFDAQLTQRYGLLYERCKPRKKKNRLYRRFMGHKSSL